MLQRASISLNLKLSAMGIVDCDWIPARSCFKGTLCGLGTLKGMHHCFEPPILRQAQVYVNYYGGQL